VAHCHVAGKGEGRGQGRPPLHASLDQTVSSLGPGDLLFVPHDRLASYRFRRAGWLLVSGLRVLVDGVFDSRLSCTPEDLVAAFEAMH
jgi:hypothetical protein